MRIGHAATKIVVAAILPLFAGLSVCQTSPQPKCLSYEPAVVSIRGTLMRKTFPGPPNYESVQKGDKPETSWLLRLQIEVCVHEDKNEPDLNPSRASVHEIQLVLNPEQYVLYETMVGRKVTATGTLFGEINGHHHTPVLLTVRDLKQSPNK